jgi:hypothetical protein
VKRRPAPPPCPDCRAPLSLGGRFCRGCGWDADLAASPDAYLDGIDLPAGYGPDDAFDEAETLHEAGLGPPRRDLRLLWRLTAAALLAMVAWWVIAHGTTPF